MTDAAVTTNGFTWCHMSNIGNFKPSLWRTMRYPEDVWRLNMAPFPVVEVRVRRMEIGPQPSDIIDVVDISLSEPATSRYITPY
jgi:hypothetical protein